MSRPEYDVSIVGYGPVGALAALLLAREGLRVSIHERSTEALALPRAVGLDGESVRAFQRIGLGDEIAALLQPARDPDELWFTNSKREKLFGLTLAGEEGHNGWRDIAFFDQPELEARLREFVAAEPKIDVVLGEEATSIEEAESHITLRLREVGTKSQRSVTASYLLGCDGASSFVRQSANIEWTSLGYDQDWLVVDIAMLPTTKLPRVTMQVCDPERLTTYVCVKDPYRRWEIQRVEGDTREALLDPRRIEELLLPWAPPDQYEIRRKAVYQFHAATADRWRHGRVFLAGDSAHQTPPFLGQGLNSGFRDAVNLGWKIPLVLSGLCDDALLDSYFDERDAHARELVDWAVGIGKLMETLAAQEAGRPNPHPDASQRDGYGQGRSVPPLRAGVLMTEQADRGQPIGHLLRQPRVRRASGESLRLDELLGSGFAVVGRARADLEVGSEASILAKRLGIRFVDLEQIEGPVEGHRFDSAFDASPAVLLRPDRIVFGVVDDDTSLDDLIRTLAEKLSLEPART